MYPMRLGAKHIFRSLNKELRTLVAPKLQRASNGTIGRTAVGALPSLGLTLSVALV